MNKKSPSIQFINHASVLISCNEVSLLSDPWYQGDAFHKGWNLINEFEDSDISNILKNTTHIWISHEHPDHFSILFFKKFKQIIIESNITILFQNTDDKRVEGFLRSQNFRIKILDENQWVSIGSDFKVLNFKDGFYDSGLVVEAGNKKFLNLNDCEIKTKSRCAEILKIVGECDVLISQFSYAAWKGGKNNIAWRKAAAKDKLETLKLQSEFFNPKYLIPFASYIYFSNENNFYLNDSVNSPRDVVNFFKDEQQTNIIVMKPFDKIDFSDHTDNAYHDNDNALRFWQDSFDGIEFAYKHTYKKIDIDSLHEAFAKYKARVFANNSYYFIKILKFMSPIPVFQNINIRLIDINKTIQFNLMNECLEIKDVKHDVEMSSESFEFIMNNSFGFDTLTVNGCFEEFTKGGFSKMTKSFAIENLNNIGISLRPSIILRLDIIYLFLNRLFNVNKKINASERS